MARPSSRASSCGYLYLRVKIDLLCFVFKGLACTVQVFRFYGIDFALRNYSYLNLPNPTFLSGPYKLHIRVHNKNLQVGFRRLR